MITSKDRIESLKKDKLKIEATLKAYEREHSLNDLTRHAIDARIKVLEGELEHLRGEMVEAAWGYNEAHIPVLRGQIELLQDLIEAEEDLERTVERRESRNKVQPPGDIELAE